MLRVDSKTEVYPRVCGGTLAPAVTPLRTRGLSPRVRGNPGWREPPRPFPRSIPACAGEPKAGSRRTGGTRVYPRVCGGTVVEADDDNAAQGLSPRVRGNHLKFSGVTQPDRSIPACAGEPRPASISPAASQVYPRVCGGTPASRRQPAPGLGLSPRVRGNQGDGPACLLRPRSIPACAGEPDAQVGCWVAGRVYPRVCGGTDRPPQGRAETRGLSPRVRGNRCPAGYIGGC